MSAREATPLDLDYLLSLGRNDNQSSAIDRQLALIAQLQGGPKKKYATPFAEAIGGASDNIGNFLGQLKEQQLMHQQGALADAKLQAVRDYSRQKGLANTIAGEDASAAGENRGGMPEIQGLDHVLANQGAFQKMEAPPVPGLGMDLGDGLQAQQFSPDEVGNRSPEDLDAILKLLRGSGMGGGF